MYDSLAELTSAFGIAGYEDDIRDAIIKNGNFAQHRVDKIGNLVCHGDIRDERPTILLDAHLDEVGFIVKFIDKDGFVYLEPLGGIDPRALIGKSILIRGNEDIVGVVSSIPPHLSQDNKMPKLSELTLDTGLSKWELDGLIGIGSPAGFISPLKRLGGSKVAGKSLDNRAGCLALCELSKRLGDSCNVIYLFSTQEEVGTRGVNVALKDLRPDLAICVDVTQGDMHFFDSPIMRKLGGGTIIGTGPNIHPKIFEKLTRAAEGRGIQHCIKAYPKPTPTNLRSIQLLGGGVPSGLLAMPCRYMHTPAEVVDVNDIISTILLLEAFIDDIDDVIEGGL